jgi:hypothetical protein
MSIWAEPVTAGEQWVWSAALSVAIGLVWVAYTNPRRFIPMAVFLVILSSALLLFALGYVRGFDAAFDALLHSVPPENVAAVRAGLKENNWLMTRLVVVSHAIIAVGAATGALLTFFELLPKYFTRGEGDSKD